MSSPGTTADPPPGFTPPTDEQVAAIAALNAGHIGTCIGCGQTDDHPHHRVALPGGEEVVWHNDCHARANPPCPICTAVTDSHGDTLKGEALRAFIVAADPGDATAQQLNEEAATTANGVS
jgi:hypothetical protein